MIIYIQARFWRKNNYNTKTRLYLNQDNTFWHHHGFHMQLTQHKACQTTYCASKLQEWLCYNALLKIRIRGPKLRTKAQNLFG